MSNAVAAALCQSCLRVRAFASWEDREACLCECGEAAENYCSCDGCLATIESLRAGALGRDIVGLQAHVEVLSWTEQNGCITRGGEEKLAATRNENKAR